MVLLYIRNNTNDISFEGHLTFRKFATGLSFLTRATPSEQLECKRREEKTKKKRGGGREEKRAIEREGRE